MNMARQIWLALAASALIALAGGLLATTLNAQAYLSQQLTMKNADNASALALALSQQAPDEATVRLVASALYDGGHYERIQVFDPAGQPRVDLQAPRDEGGVPGWFQRAFPVDAAPGSAQITSGWRQVGIVRLESHRRFAYRALWEASIEMLGALVLAGLLGGALAAAILRRLKAPLDAVVAQARAISERRFETIELPRVPELHQLAKAMNLAVGRLRAYFVEEATRLESIREQINCDPLTGLPNRTTFIARLDAALDDTEAGAGHLVLVRISDLAGLNRRLGRQATDSLLRECAGRIGELALAHGDAVAGRLNGADFALILPPGADSVAGVETLAGGLALILERAGAQPSRACVAHGRFVPGEPRAGAIARVDAALAGSESNGQVQVADAALKEAALGEAQWRFRILDAAANGRAALGEFPVVDAAGRLIHVESPLRLCWVAGGPWIPAGEFLPMAERLGITAVVDLEALRLGLEALDRSPALPGLAINLSTRSLDSATFREGFATLVRRHRGSMARLWVEFAERGVFSGFEAFCAFADVARKAGCRVGIEHFGFRAGDIGRLHEPGLDYLKVDAAYIAGLHDHPGNRQFLRGLCGIAHGIGVQVFAEGVPDRDTAAILEIEGFDGVTGPGVAAPPRNDQAAGTPEEKR